VCPAQSFIGSLGWRKLLERVLGKSGIDVSEEGWRQPAKAECTGSVKGSYGDCRGKLGTWGGSMAPTLGGIRGSLG
jgi:hypothetical protein